MSSYPNLPGTQINILDGGLNSRIVPKAKRTLVLGVSGKGPAGIGYQVTSRSTAAPSQNNRSGIDQVPSS